MKDHIINEKRTNKTSLTPIMAKDNDGKMASLTNVNYNNYRGGVGRWNGNVNILT